MNKIHLAFCLGIILVIGFSFSGCQAQKTNEEKSEPAGESAPSSITLTPEAIKTAGIQSAEAGLRPNVEKVHATGEIIFNSKRLVQVTARTSGRIEQLFSYQGDKVKTGQLLLLLYSQDFLSLQAELVQALGRSKRTAAEPAEQIAAQSLLDSVRNRLRLLDVSNEELAEIEKAGTIKPVLSVRAPLAGSIIESLVNAGDFVEFGANLFKIADLSTVWVDIHIFEKDLFRVRQGSEAVIRTAGLPGREFHGRLFQIGDVVEAKTRTIEGKVELQNPAGELKPGLYIEADIVWPTDEKSLFVPSEAVQDFQNKKIVFVRTGENTFSRREVETGTTLNGFIEISKGLKEKEVVATSGSFFIKSELLKKSLGEEQP